ncbi:MAG: DEAD/DEAH box helicase [bacterium]|nr:DEAD/DEAH box helicase [bacterium]
MRALKRAKALSKDLQKEFLQFLKDFEDWEAQALYLLEDKGDEIESIIEALLGVPLADQADWKKPTKEVGFEDPEFDQVIPPPPDPNKPTSTSIHDYPQFGFKDWKQEHGFDTVPVEVGDIHTIIRFRQVYTAEREAKFHWSFNRSRYGIRGWGNEKPIKSINKSLLDNNNNPGWVVKTFLDENRLLTDEEHELRGDGEIPNPLVLSSRDTHSLLFLLLGHPFLYYEDSLSPVRNSFKKVEFDLNVFELNNHRILAGVFYHYENDGTKKPIVTDDFAETGIMLFGLPKAILYENKYFEILPTPIPAKMIRDSFKGILIPNDEWKDFSDRWQQWYPEKQLHLCTPNEAETPNFKAREVRSWQYWLSKPEAKVEIFAEDTDVIEIRLHEETKHFNTNKLAVTLSEDWDGNTCTLYNPAMSPKAAKLMQVFRAIFTSKMTDGFYTLERHQASQMLILAEEYPYAYSYAGNQHMINPERLDFRVVVTRNPENENQYLLKGEIGRFVLDKKGKSQFERIGKKEGIMPKAVGMAPAFLLEEDQLKRVGSMLSGRLINDTMAGVVVEESEISDFYAAALPYLKQRNIEIHDPQGVLRVSALFNYKLHGKMTIWEVGGVLMGRLETVMVTGIGEMPYPLELNADEFEQTLDKKTYKIPKDIAQEQALKDQLYATGWVGEGEDEYSMREDMAMVFVLETLPNKDPESLVTYFGGTKLKRWKTKKLVPEIATTIQSGIDWFDVSVTMTIDGQLFDLKKLVNMWKNNEEAVELKAGEGIAVIDSGWIEKYAPILNRLIQTTRSRTGKGKKGLEELIEEIDIQPEALQVDKYQVGLLTELEAIASQRDHDEEWEAIQQKLTNFKGIRNQRIPKEVQAKLRDYQREGVNWLCFLYEYGFGGILADDMGLGKTLQTLTYLAILKKKTRNKRPSLVIAPTSVVTNWLAEVKKFVPHFNAVLLHGQKRKDHFEAAEKADLVITTYGLLQRDLEWLTSQEFHVVILDEAQNIKNARSKTSQAVMQLRGDRRITLTGTPIENSVMELWSQFNFLMPGFFGPLKEFERDFVKPKKKVGGKKKRTDHGLLRRQTKPFILRRLKQNVAKELPPKTQQTLYSEMGEQQKKLYMSVMEIVRQQVKEKISAGGVNGAKIAIFDALLKLRQICCDPRLSPLAGENPPPSAKYKLFMETLTEIVGEGHRVLVFSQFVKMLNLMHEDLNKEGIPFLQLDGTSKNREELVNKFQQSDDYPVFLISLKAGGTGINLTAADYVIHYDPWWNPAAEAQATDRAYRIGQKNHLFVYKLITRNSIEEKILDLQEKKQALADNIVGNSESLEDMLNLDDLNDLFAL